MENITAIILAAGRGTRMQSTDRNKVTLEVGGRPMISRTLEILEKTGIKNFVVVVGFAKESVIKLLPKNVSIAEQTEQLGTGHAVQSALAKVPKDSDVLIVNGDDAFMHKPETFRDLYQAYKVNRAKLAFITAEMEDPTGLGRIIRSQDGQVTGIVEEKNATEEQKKIKEVNIGCYVINKNDLLGLLEKVEKNPVSGEYYLTDIIDLIVGQKDMVTTFKLESGTWRGVNTREDLGKAEQILQYEQ